MLNDTNESAKKDDENDVRNDTDINISLNIPYNERNRASGVKLTDAVFNNENEQSDNTDIDKNSCIILKNRGNSNSNRSSFSEPLFDDDKFKSGESLCDHNDYLKDLEGEVIAPDEVVTSVFNEKKIDFSSTDASLSDNGVKLVETKNPHDIVRNRARSRSDCSLVIGERLNSDAKSNKVTDDESVEYDECMKASEGGFYTRNSSVVFCSENPCSSKDNDDTRSLDDVELQYSTSSSNNFDNRRATYVRHSNNINHTTDASEESSYTYEHDSLHGNYGSDDIRKGEENTSYDTKTSDDGDSLSSHSNVKLFDKEVLARRTSDNISSVGSFLDDKVEAEKSKISELSDIEVEGYNQGLNERSKKHNYRTRLRTSFPLELSDLTAEYVSDYTTRKGGDEIFERGMANLSPNSGPRLNSRFEHFSSGDVSSSFRLGGSRHSIFGRREITHISEDDYYKSSSVFGSDAESIASKNYESHTNIRNLYSTSVFKSKVNESYTDEEEEKDQKTLNSFRPESRYFDLKINPDILLDDSGKPISKMESSGLFNEEEIKYIGNSETDMCSISSDEIQYTSDIHSSELESNDDELSFNTLDKILSRYSVPKESIEIKRTGITMTVFDVLKNF